MYRRAVVAMMAATVLITSGALTASAAGGGANGATMTTREVKGGQKTVLARGTAGGSELAPAIGPGSRLRAMSQLRTEACPRARRPLAPAPASQASLREQRP